MNFELSQARGDAQRSGNGGENGNGGLNDEVPSFFFHGVKC